MTKKINKEVSGLTRGYYVKMKDEYGEILYNFMDKKKADEYYEKLSKALSKFYKSIKSKK